MPFAFDPLEEQKKQEEQQAGGAAPAMTGGGQSFSGGGAGQPQVDDKQQKGAGGQGSGFVNLDKYMGANQASGFGNQFAGKVQGEIDAGKKALNDGANQFTGASNAGAVKWNDVQGEVGSLVDSAKDGVNDDEVKRFQGLSNASYQGPESFLGTDFGKQAQSGVQKAAQTSKATQSEGGRFALLDQYYGRPKYSGGEKTLDNLLVSNSKGFGARAQNMGNQAKDLTAQGMQAEQNMNNLATTNRAATNETRTNTAKAVGDAMTGAQGQANQAVIDANAARDAKFKAVQDAFSDGVISEQESRDLGINYQGQTYGADASGFLQQGGALSLNQVMTPQQRAHIQALSQLSGVEDTFASGAEVAQNDPYNFDAQGFGGAVEGKKTEYNSELNALKDSFATGTAAKEYKDGNPEQWIERLNEQKQKVLERKNPNQQDVDFWQEKIDAVMGVMGKYGFKSNQANGASVRGPVAR